MYSDHGGTIPASSHRRHNWSPARGVKVHRPSWRSFPTRRLPPNNVPKAKPYASASEKSSKRHSYRVSAALASSTRRAKTRQLRAFEATRAAVARLSRTASPSWHSRTARSTKSSETRLKSSSVRPDLSSNLRTERNARVSLKKQIGRAHV